MIAVLVGLCWSRGKSLAVSAGVCVVAFIGLWPLFIIRPQTFSFLLFVLLYAVLEGARQRSWLLVLPPVLLALWVNLHGAFPVGLVLIGVYLGAAFLVSVWESGWGVLRDRSVWLLAGCLLFSTLATLVNPYGWRVYEYVLHTSGIARARGIDEWLPPGTTTLTARVWVASLAGMYILFALPGRRPAVREVCLLVVFLVQSAGSVRMVAWWLVIVAPIAASIIADRLAMRNRPRPEQEPPSLATGAVSLLLLGGMVLSLPWLENVNPLFLKLRSPHRVESDLEAVAAKVRETRASGKVFTRFEWGEYLTWTLGERYPVFMDARIEIYPDEVWNDYKTITSGGAGWDSLLKQKYDVDFLLIDQGPYHGRLRPLVQEAPDDWTLVGAEGPVLLYQRVRSRRQ
jgi:hypothetical protein